MDTLIPSESAPGPRALVLAILVMVVLTLFLSLPTVAPANYNPQLSKDSPGAAARQLEPEGGLLEVKLGLLPDQERYYLAVEDPYPTDGTDTSPVGGIITLIMGSMLIVAGLIFVIDLLILIWIYKDAEKRGKSGIGWLIFAFFCGPLACLIWLLVRPPLTNRPSREPTTRPPPTAAGYASPGAPASASASGATHRGKSAALGLGHEAGASGMVLPRGSEATERPLFGAGGYFSSQSDPDEEEEYYDEEAYQPAPGLPADAPPTETPPPPPTEEGGMVVTVACPGCGHQFEVPSTGGPQTITCPSCQLSGTMTV